MRLAAVGDLHVKKTSHGLLQPLLAPVNDHADVLLLCGDLTDYGLKEEAVILAKELTAAVRIPIVAVLGNHDYESGQHAEVCRILTESGVRVLDGEAFEIQGVGIAGAKGFSGGFGRATLGAWGEPATKRYVQEAIDEALKLEAARDRGRRAARNHLLPGHQPSRRASQPSSRRFSIPRARAPWCARGPHEHWDAGLQRSDALAAAEVSRPASVPCRGTTFGASVRNGGGAPECREVRGYASIADRQ
jgi:hypothetical protein